jgi:hypothetical protein
MDKFMIDKYIEDNSTKPFIENPLKEPFVEKPFLENQLKEPFVEKPFLENQLKEPFVEKPFLENQLKEPFVEKPFLENQLKEPFVEKPFIENPLKEPFVEKPFIENPIKPLKESEQGSMFQFVPIISFLFIFVGFGLYYAVKYNHNENHYLIKKNAKKFDITLDELKTDIKNAMKEKYEEFIDWKERLRTSTKKYIFNKHLENGAFKTTKYKATNLLSMFKPMKI